ncbi:hypothetical protein DEU56DRAFT_913002 [Suillus clintonianus]|uniref:uncharacterized protein n=1 Tax=Suillus clintonianus TaxID=1904413 RepID=UPI001B875972|nr:uncharacterized protein DEU56DRAFT_913002 [Suillus clintonianus]KAG2136423.1 hypothetical protein DEU56DRAFT_913002 [Suillus clintonianus]
MANMQRSYRFIYLNASNYANAAGGNQAVNNPNANAAGGDQAVNNPNANAAEGDQAVNNPNANAAGGDQAGNDPNANAAEGDQAVNNPNANAAEGDQMQGGMTLTIPRGVIDMWELGQRVVQENQARVRQGLRPEVLPPMARWERCILVMFVERRRWNLIRQMNELRELELVLGLEGMV